MSSFADEAVARFEALLSPAGQELLAALRDEPPAPDAGLRLGTRLRARYPAGLVADALTQHELRLAARTKFSRAMEMYFTRPGLEQASAEAVAGYRAHRFRGAGRLADLCCGIGGDLLALAAGHPVLAVDKDPLHLRIARANAEVLGVAGNVTTLAADVRDAGLDGVGAVFIDPARRTGRGRLRAGVSEPPLEWCAGLAARVDRVGVKAAPGLPRDAVPDGWELEFIAAGRNLKEAAAWSPALATASTRATILPGGLPPPAGPARPQGHPLTGGDALAAAHTLTPQPGPPVPVRPPGEYLFDPNPAVTRAGAVADLARLLGAWQIDEQIAFLSADTPASTPFARTLQVIDSAPWNQKQLPARLRGLDIGAVDIRRRGLAGDTGRLHRSLRLSGSRRATLVMTRVRDRPWGLVCLDVPASG